MDTIFPALKSTTNLETPKAGVYVPMSVEKE